VSIPAPPPPTTTTTTTTTSTTTTTTTTPPPPPPSGACDGSAGVYLYELKNYTGRCSRFTTDSGNASAWSIGNDQASSIRLVGGYIAVVFLDFNYGGEWNEFQIDDPDASTWFIGDNATSSVRVRVASGSPTCFGLLEAGATACATSAVRPPNFGGKYLDLSDIRGLRAGIQAPTANFVLPYNTAAVMRVSAENSNFHTLVQTGFGRTLRRPHPFCGDSPGTAIVNFWEYIKPPAGGADYRCAWGATTPLGSAQAYAVYRRNQSATGNTTTWQVNLNGVEQAQALPGFDAALRAIAGGEIVNPDGILPFDRPDGKVYGCYGCVATPLGVMLWQRTASAGNAGYVNINSANNITEPPFTSTSRWTVGNLPGAFEVSHRCDGRHGCKP
jgi:hypothetical protein